jgi:hypothetical protein
MSAAANVHVRRVERCYWLVGADGTIYNDGDAAPLAKLPPLSTGISAIAAAPNGVVGAVPTAS